MFTVNLIKQKANTVNKLLLCVFHFALLLFLPAQIKFAFVIHFERIHKSNSTPEKAKIRSSTCLISSLSLQLLHF